VKTIGENLENSTVHIDLGGNESKRLRVDGESTSSLRQYVITAKEIEQLGGIGKQILVTDDKNKTKRYDIGDLTMPTVKDTIPSNGMIKTGGEITIIGDRLEKIEDGESKITAYFQPAGTLIAIEKENVKTGDIVKEIGTEIGKYDVVFEHKDTIDGVTVNKQHYYFDVFSVYGELNISDDVVMTPNQGAPGTQVILEASDIPENISVFFKKNSYDLYDMKNMAEFVSYDSGADDQKHKYIFKVPNIDQGSYEVFLTNKVEKNQNPNTVINSSKTFKNNIFVIISDANKPVISEVMPKVGPATGVDAVIRGRNLISINPNIFKLTEDISPKLDPGVEITEGVDVLKDELVVLYEKDDNKKIGEYSVIKKNNKSVDVLSLERKITGVVGNTIQFREGSELKQGGTDTIQVRIPSTTDEETEPIKDVTLEMETKIKYQYKDDDGEDEVDTITLKEEVVKKGGFTYEQLSYRPEISAITPNQIPVDGVANNYKTSLENMKIHISGKNFSVYRYEDDGGVKYKYPEVNIGNKITLNKNTDPTVDIKVFDKNGNEIDGTKGNDLGEKILITIPKDFPTTIGLKDGDINANIDTWVVNPNRNEDPTEMGYTSNSMTVKFVKIGEDKTPSILSIIPDTVTILGEKGVKITGDKFYPGVKVYINGDEIKNIKRNDDGTELTFDAPPRPEGYYQILVQNEEGGAEIYCPFTYTKTYTEPKITDFNPKKGTAGTLVTITGQSFVLPNPLVADLGGIGISKLIGTRVLLGVQDVNTYVDGKRQPNGLQGYESLNGDLIELDDNGRIKKLSDYYHSVILQEDQEEQEGNDIYYIIYHDTKDGKIKLTDGDKQVYTIGRTGAKPETDFNVTKEGLEIDDKILKMMTPYDIKDGEIVGNNVKVKNNNELIFEVPAMPREGYYDVTIINPDTKKDSKIENAGFYYSFQPEFNPEIREIKPNTGSTDGEYYINIIGNKFIDNGGDNKTSVTIGTITVDPKDVEISPDGKNIKVKVPKYPGDLEKETDTDRKTVVVVLVNPDGGSASIEDGFTYIIPISHPKIDKLILNKGSAAGGENVIIEGSGFRFFEPYEDLNNNVEWDEGEPFENLNGNVDKNGKPIWDDLRHWLSSELKAKYDELAKDYNNKIVPILPKIYFGGEEVAIRGFTASTIEIETPKGAKGPAEVYLVNNDYGTSNKVTFTYEASNPRINTITPGIGRKQGNEKVEIMGENLKESKVKVIETINKTKEQTLQLVQFGDLKDVNISNRDIPMDAPQNSGRIRDNQTTVKVGDLTVKYDATQDKRKLNFTIEEGTGDKKAIYNFEYADYDDTEIFLPVSLLKKGNGDISTQDGDESSNGEGAGGNYYDGYEYVKINLEVITGANRTNRLRVDRGFSPKATLIRAGQIVLNTPSYYTVGSVPVTLVNPDGGEAITNFEYKNPDSDPRITNITRDGQQPQLGDDGKIKILTVNAKGGSEIVIEGNDFRDVQRIQIGNVLNIESKDITEEPNRLIFKMPTVADSALTFMHRVVVTNYDGGTASSDEASPPIYIQFTKGESNPQIEEITPPRGPDTGGNTVVIKGGDFREAMEGYEGGKLRVYFDGNQVPDSDVTFIDYKTISVIAPPGKAGPVDVKVENPDGEMSNTVQYTYASNPRITSVVDPLDSAEKAVISAISIEGGQEIKLKGTGFMANARVY
ncbi:MAG TPA: IPT/TIG domain-containing protein, partial [Oscillospiraceae bacterium]|nr:IPT/TIG domain-containing protein [Oscillospiraceae bacterium]